MVSFYRLWAVAALGSGVSAAAATYPNGTTSSVCADWCWKTVTATVGYAEPTTVYKTVTEIVSASGYGDTVTSWRTATVTASGESSNQTLTEYKTSTVVSTEEDKTTEKTTETAYQNSTIT